MLDTSKIKMAKYPLYISIVSIRLRVPSGKVTELITELMFDGLNILRSEDRRCAFSIQMTLANRPRSVQTCRRSSRKSTRLGQCLTSHCPASKMIFGKTAEEHTTCQSGWGARRKPKRSSTVAPWTGTTSRSAAAL
jgi:hypothetical protein